MDLLDGSDEDMIEMDPPRRRWERYGEQWRVRWQESRRVTRASIAAGAVLAVAGGTGIAYAVTRSAAPAAATGSASSAASKNVIRETDPPSSVLWARGPHDRPWAAVADGAPFTGTSDVQIGTVTAVNPASLTLESSGGHVTTYSVIAATQVNFQGDEIGSVRKGEIVDVISTPKGKAAVALVIESFAATGQGGQGPDRIAVVNPVTGKPGSEIILP
jgi:hypothetical protein